MCDTDREGVTCPSYGRPGAHTRAYTGGIRTHVETRPRRLEGRSVTLPVKPLQPIETKSGSNPVSPVLSFLDQRRVFRVGASTSRQPSNKHPDTSQDPTPLLRRQRVRDRCPSRDGRGPRRVPPSKGLGPVRTRVSYP